MTTNDTKTGPMSEVWPWALEQLRKYRDVEITGSDGRKFKLIFSMIEAYETAEMRNPELTATARIVR